MCIRDSLKGHGEKSVMLLSQYLSLTMEEILCIRYHMGAFVDQKEWNDYTRAIHEYPNILWTHMADMIAAHILEVDKGPRPIIFCLKRGERNAWCNYWGHCWVQI